jgi:agmatinase
VANRCVREILTGVAMRRKGITEPHYLHPDAIDHGQG